MEGTGRQYESNFSTTINTKVLKINKRYIGTRASFMYNTDNAKIINLWLFSLVNLIALMT